MFWWRLHRIIYRLSQEALPLYLGFFEFLHNVGRRGKSLLQPLVNLLVT
ncbi:hypothetical protein [Endozoicomonas atrinae]